MPKVEGVYRAGNGSWYFKATVGRDPLTGKPRQVTKRGSTTATEPARARRELLRGRPGGAHERPLATATRDVDTPEHAVLRGDEPPGILTPNRAQSQMHVLRARRHM